MSKELMQMNIQRAQLRIKAEKGRSRQGQHAPALSFYAASRLDERSEWAAIL